jgi:hypothetical protein
MEVMSVSKPQISGHRISVKVADRRLEFLEDRSKELGLSSKAELFRWYIVSDMAGIIGGGHNKDKPKEGHVFLEGIIMMDA